MPRTGSRAEQRCPCPRPGFQTLQSGALHGQVRALARQLVCAPEKGSEVCVAAVGPVSGSPVPGRWVQRDSAVERGPRGGQGYRPHQGGPSEAHRFQCSVTWEWHYWEGSGLGVAGPVGGSVSLKVEGLKLQTPRPGPGPGSLSACGSGMYSSELPATRQDPVSRYTVDKTGRVSSKCLSVNLGLCTPPALSHI